MHAEIRLLVYLQPFEAESYQENEWDASWRGLHPRVSVMDFCIQLQSSEWDRRPRFLNLAQGYGDGVFRITYIRSARSRPLLVHVPSMTIPITRSTLNHHSVTFSTAGRNTTCQTPAYHGASSPSPRRARITLPNLLGHSDLVGEKSAPTAFHAMTGSPFSKRSG